MGRESYELGKQGEATAEQYLQQKGYDIIERNFHSQQGEIDLIAKEGDFLVFVEVKSYSFRSYGSPVGAVRKMKKQSIIHAARTYLYKKNIKDTYCRFDVVAIYRRFDGSTAIELYKNAFMVN
ncbi:MAG: YraN family protein [Candidatus Margulisbacteria bacterium]|nr:YraN family protein [Candidatus Margulisiibacteriota bacterium]